MNKLPSSLTRTFNLDQAQTKALPENWNLVWRQKILFVKPSQEFYQPWVLSRKYKKRLIDCLDRLSIKFAKIYPYLYSGDLKEQ